MKNIQPQELAKILKSENIILVDVREPHEYDLERIENAENIPLSKLSAGHFQSKQYKNKKIVLYCKSGKRSLDACKKIKALEEKNEILNLEGGIASWKENKMKVIYSGKKIPPISQQLHIAIGLIIILTGPVMHMLKIPFWYVLQILVGIGLINSGIKGNCRLMQILKMMPWNKEDA